ncbi:MAG: hypothetical protein ACTSRA_00795 [Promethearchaeota archaeon]|nr:MAG: hypothetical protein [Helarchaeota virus Nidhogg Meg22_1214]
MKEIKKKLKILGYVDEYAEYFNGKNYKNNFGRIVQKKLKKTSKNK